MSAKKHTIGRDESADQKGQIVYGSVFWSGMTCGRQTGGITHSGLWINECSNSIHCHAQVFPLGEVNAVVSKHVAADIPNKTSSYYF